MRNLFWFLGGVLMAVVLAVAVGVGDAAAGDKGPDWIPPGHRTDGGNNSQIQGQAQGRCARNG